MEAGFRPWERDIARVSARIKKRIVGCIIENGFF